jgi:hypothetical protein
MTCRGSVEDISESSPTPCAQLRNPNHILEAADGSDDDANMPGLADEESGKESDATFPRLLHMAHDYLSIPGNEL